MEKVFTDLFTYNYHTNQSFIDLLKGIAPTNEKTFQLMSHLLNAHAIWLARIAQKNSPFEVWAMHAIDECEQLNLDNFEQSKALIDNLKREDYGKVIHYQTSKGIPFQNTLQDILLHIINHSTHHRAQIALLLRQQDVPPPISDYIFYKRDTD